MGERHRSHRDGHRHRYEDRHRSRRHRYEDRHRSRRHRDEDRHRSRRHRDEDRHRSRRHRDEDRHGHRSRREHDEARRAHDARKAERHRIREMRRYAPQYVPMPPALPQMHPQMHPQMQTPYQVPQYAQFPPPLPQYQPLYQPPPQPPPQPLQPPLRSALRKGSPKTQKSFYWGNVADPHQRRGAYVKEAAKTRQRVSDPLKFLKEQKRQQAHDRRKHGMAINAPSVVFQDKGAQTGLGVIKEGRRKHGRLEFRIEEEGSGEPIHRGWFPLEKLMELGKGTPLETWCADQQNCQADSYPERH